VRVVLRNPDREVDIAGDRPVGDVLSDLAIDPDTVLVIRSGELLTRHDRVREVDRLELRPVISGGSA
jgi:sulfur carrier protein